MATIYQLKSKFQNLLRPIANFLAKTGTSANQVTLFTMLISVSFGLYFLFSTPVRIWFFLIPVLLFVRMALNAIDGMMAREHHMQTRLGAVLNELCDVASDTFLYYPLALAWGVNIHLNVLFLFFSILTEMTGVIAVQIGGSRRYDGPLGKSDRAFVIGLLSLIYALGYDFWKWQNEIYLALIILSVMTVVNRGYKALAEKAK
jgi:CDP-diacylglycerol--glycerol-3-phosphate 3-phosphatidyltransferase